MLHDQTSLKYLGFLRKWLSKLHCTCTRGRTTDRKSLSWQIALKKKKSHLWRNGELRKLQDNRNISCLIILSSWQQSHMHKCGVHRRYLKCNRFIMVLTVKKLICRYKGLCYVTFKMKKASPADRHKMRRWQFNPPWKTRHFFSSLLSLRLRPCGHYISEPLGLRVLPAL